MDYVYLKATAAMYYIYRGQSNGNRFLTPTRLSSAANGAPLIAKKTTDILFVLNNSHLYLATPSDMNGMGGESDGATSAIVRVVAPIIHTGIAIQ